MAKRNAGSVAGGLRAIPEYVGTNPNATTQQHSPSMFTHIETKNMLSLRAKPARASKWSQRYYVIANPETFSESVAPQYARRPVLGLSHDVVQYIRTASREISMELWCSYHVLRLRNSSLNREQGLVALRTYRNYFESLTVPSEPRLAPPLVNVHWPQAQLYFQGVVSDLSIEYTRFAYDGTPTEFTADISFLEVGRGLMTHGRVRGMGWGARVGTDNWWDF